MKVLVTNRDKRKVSVKVSFYTDDGEESNAYLPKSYFKERFYDSDTKYICHLMKIDPTKPWGNIKVKVEAVEKSSVPGAPIIRIGAINTSVGSSGTSISLGGGYIGTTTTFVKCNGCHKMNDFGQDYCDACGEPMNEMADSVMENYFTAGNMGSGVNNMY